MLVLFLFHWEMQYELSFDGEQMLKDKYQFVDRFLKYYRIQKSLGSVYLLIIMGQQPNRLRGGSRI